MLKLLLMKLLELEICWNEKFLEIFYWYIIFLVFFIFFIWHIFLFYCLYLMDLFDNIHFFFYFLDEIKFCLNMFEI